MLDTLHLFEQNLYVCKYSFNKGTCSFVHFNPSADFCTTSLARHILDTSNICKSVYLAMRSNISDAFMPNSASSFEENAYCILFSADRLKCCAHINLQDNNLQTTERIVS